MRSFLCSWNAHDQNVLARQPQSKASHTLAWSGDERGESKRQRARWKIHQPPSLRRERASLEGLFALRVPQCPEVRIDRDNPEK